ncbi:hypothetical protein [Synechococcus sp. UW140]|uniref:hypothetical protein n=1 Tax=Synechococcus sp. UW140 TaxID=368503 RepID=UPI000E0EE041|nr:hypothetical protein [Synechococcus sp. UW140]
MDVQQQYLAAEQAYGDGDFQQAETIASNLLRHLGTGSRSGAEQDALLAWRAFVALLLGHIYFHGLNQPGQALDHYQLVLNSQPPDTLRDLAQQGLDRCKGLAEQEQGYGPNEPETKTGSALIESLDAGGDQDTLQALIQDPFLQSSVSAPTQLQPVASATPWLNSTTSTRESILAQTDRPVEPNSPEAAEPRKSQASNDSDNPNNAAPSETDREPLSTERMVTADPDRPDQQLKIQKGLDLKPWLLRRTVSFNKL